VFYGAEPGPHWPWLLPTVALGTLGFALIATLYAGLTANLRARESLLPVLMFPVVVPILLAAVRASGALVGLGDLDLARGWLLLLSGFDLVYVVLCTAMYHFVVEE
jgi:heme exporter protein B